MPIPPKPTLTEQQRRAAEEKFLNGTGGTNISVDGNEDNKTVNQSTKTIRIEVPREIWYKAKIHAMQMDIPLKEYYVKAIQELNNK